MGLIPNPAQWVKDPALPKPLLRLQLWLRSEPWPGNSICHGAAKIENLKNHFKKLEVLGIDLDGKDRLNFFAKQMLTHRC